MHIFIWQVYLPESQCNWNFYLFWQTFIGFSLFFEKMPLSPQHVIEAKILYKSQLSCKIPEVLSKNFPSFLRVLVMIKIMPVLCLPWFQLVNHLQTSPDLQQWQVLLKLDIIMVTKDRVQSAPWHPLLQALCHVKTSKLVFCKGIFHRSLEQVHSSKTAIFI